MSFVITEPLVRSVLDTVDAGLVDGMGAPKPGMMCVESAVSYALGEPHSDRPSCVDPVVRDAQVALNDAVWSSPAARARGLRRVAIAQLGSKGVIDPVRFVTRLAELTIREIVPLALRAAAVHNPFHAEDLERAATVCVQGGTAAAATTAEGVAEAARAARAATYAAEAARAARAATYAARAAARAATYAAEAAEAARAARAAGNAAECAAEYAAEAAGAAGNAAYAAAYAAEAAEAADPVLAVAASVIERALHECGSPGCDWLWLADATETHDVSA